MKSYSNEQGFTLLEVIISIALLGIVSLLFTSIMGVSGRIGDSGVTLTKDSWKQTEQIEKGEIISNHEWGESFSLSFPGLEELVIKGQYYESKSSQEESYILFVPEGK